MPLDMSDQPGITASSSSFSRIATPSPSSSHRARSDPGSGSGRPCGCLVCSAGISGARPEPSRARSVVAGAGWWLAIQVAAMAVVESCMYAAVVDPSHSTTTRLLA